MQRRLANVVNIGDDLVHAFLRRPGLDLGRLDEDQHLSREEEEAAHWVAESAFRQPSDQRPHDDPGSIQ
jgi:hypothetical protein